MKKINFIFSFIFIFSLTIFSQTTERQIPESWSSAIKQAAFINRFEPMPEGKTTSNTWGDDGVKNRYIDNGAECDTFSIWGANIIKGNDNYYHFFPNAWPENNPKGNLMWPYSSIYHYKSKSLNGPFHIENPITIGHGTEMYKTDNGTYVLFYLHGFTPEFRTSKNLNAKNWPIKKMEFNVHNRILSEELRNLTFARRQDGSFLVVARGGEILISKDGLTPFNLITDEGVYPRREGCFEDPVVWRDSVQYNLIVNDWYGRIAYYLRSGDGITWNENIGEAYKPGIAYHKDGSIEDWFKFERIKIFQDQYGRAVQANFAVLDTTKKADLGGDKHNAKNVCLPLNPGLLLEYVSNTNKEITIRIKGEKDFTPSKNINIKTLAFGLPYFVDLNKGIKPKSITKESNGNLLLTFEKKDLLKNYTNPSLDHIYTTIKGNYFAYKLIGNSNTNKILFGYINIPEFNKTHPILISNIPKFNLNKRTLSTFIYNFGKDAIIISTPYITESGKENDPIWWGDINKTTQYIKDLIPYIAKKYNADTTRVLLCGFSRGAIGTSFVGLHDNSIAKLWSAFFTNDDLDGYRKWNSTTWGSPYGVYQNDAQIRLKRANDKPWYLSFNDDIEKYQKVLKHMQAENFADFTYANIPLKDRFPKIPNKTFKYEHNDLWPAFDFPQANNARAWVKDVLKF